MLTYTSGRNLFGDLANTTASAALSLADKLINEGARKVISAFRWPFLQRTATMYTVADQQFYTLPGDFRKLLGNPYITSGSTQYITKECPTRAYWDYLNQTSFSSTIPEWSFVFNGQVGFYPTPSSNDNAITLPYSIRNVDLAVADYTINTITTVPYTVTFTAVIAAAATSATLSANWGLTTGTYMLVFSTGEVRSVTLTNGSAAVTFTAVTTAATTAATVNSSTNGSMIVGASTVWTAKMVGRWIRITDSDTALTGDGQWYQIKTRVADTHITLTSTYQGSAIASGTAAYTIGQVSAIPEDYENLPVYYALMIYFASVMPDVNKMKIYQGLYVEGLAQMKLDYGSKTEGVTIADTDQEMINPNLIIRG